MKDHVLKRGDTWTFIADVPDQRAQRCTTCNSRHWVELERPIQQCPKAGCDGAMGEPKAERRQVWRSGFQTQTLAKKAYREFLGHLDGGGDPIPQTITLREWSERWLASDRVRQLRVSTRTKYGRLLADHVLPSIGSMRVDQLRPRHIGAVLDEVALKGIETGHVRSALSTCLRDAVEAELLVANPVAGVRRTKRNRPDLSVPNAEQLVALMTAARQPDPKADGRRRTTWEIPLLLSATTGARRSEVLGIRWADVDLETGRLRITQSVQRVRDTGTSTIEFLPVKTERSRRRVDLPAMTVERLKRHRLEQNERRLRLGTAWQAHDLVCERGDGGPFDPDSFSTGFKRLLAKAGLPQSTRLHDVRHGVATVMLDRGVHPAIVSAVLGHSNVGFTLTTYSHVLDGMTERAADALGEAFGG